LINYLFTPVQVEDYLKKTMVDKTVRTGGEPMRYSNCRAEKAEERGSMEMSRILPGER